MIRFHSNLYFCPSYFWNKDYFSNNSQSIHLVGNCHWSSIFKMWTIPNTVDAMFGFNPQALVSFKKCMPPPLPYFKVNICPLPLPHFASIFFAYLWSSRWPNYIATLPRYFSFRLSHLNINTGPPSDELDNNIQRKSHFLFFSHWNRYHHFRSVLNWFRN